MHPLVFLLLPFLVGHVASSDATSEANRLTSLLKNALELNQIESLQSFVSHDFTYNSCQSVLNYDQFLSGLEKLAAPPLAISVDWSIRDAQFVDDVLFFVLHYNDQDPVSYADIQFEAKVFGNDRYSLTKGVSMACHG